MLKCLKLDNGGEYCSKEFDRYCLENGIRREKTVLGRPQENGVSERMNETVMECARCMILHAGLPLQFWTNAVDIVVYLIKRGPSSSLDGGIQKDVWIGKKVNYSLLKTLVVKPLSTKINKIEQSLRKNQRNVPLLDIVLMILVIAFMIMKDIKSLGEDMPYSIKKGFVYGSDVGKET